MLFVVSLVAAASVTAADWPRFRGPAGDGISPEKGINTDWKAKPPKLLWMSEGAGNGFASVSISGDRIFTTGNKDNGQCVTAFSATDGKLLWATSLTPKNPKHGYDGSRCTPSVDGDRLYAMTSDGGIACLQSSDGKVLWRKDFKKEWKGKMMSGWGFSESPLVDGNNVVCTPGGKAAFMVALNKTTGAEVWRTAVPASMGDRGKDGAGYSSLVISNGAGVKQYLAMTGRGVVSVRASDGKFLWVYNRVANTTANIPNPIAFGDYVFSSTGYGTGSGLVKLSKDGDGVKAEQMYWLEAKTLQNHHGGLVKVGDHIYTGHKHNNGFPICIEAATGKVVWGGDIRGVGKGSAAIVYADGHLIYRYQSGEVGLIEATPAEYRLKGTLKPTFISGPSWAHPVVINGRLYLREKDKLMCYDLAK
jgi:outer membrane protein assembly factor BamB